MQAVAKTQPITSKPHFESHELVLWHILIDNRSRAIPGVVIAANDEQRIAMIKVRNLAGHTQCVTVSYREIEAR